MSIEELESLRKKARNTLLIGYIGSVILSIVVAIAIGMPQFIFMITVAGIVITTIVGGKSSKAFSLAYKQMFVLKSLEAVFTDLVYEPEKGISYSVIRDTGMMYMGDRYTSNDYVKGKYKNINVEQADVHIEEEHETTDSDGNTTTTWVTIFRGRWMIFDFNKEFKANIQVSQKGFGNSKVSNWGSKLKYKKVAMEDQDFNNKFRTYAQDEHEAFYILTPSLMEKIKKITGEVKGKMLFCFVDDKLHIGIYNNKDSFEHGVFTKVDETKAVEDVTKDVKVITNFIDELSLDNDLFKKGN